jgi:hypothetical protein
MGVGIGDDGGAALTPGPEWQLLTTTYVVNAADSALNVRFQGEDAADGACFTVDAVCLVEVKSCP